MLYEDDEKLKASALILSLALKPAHLKTLAENGEQFEGRQTAEVAF